MNPSRHFQCLALDKLSYINGVIYIYCKYYLLGLWGEGWGVEGVVSELIFY